MKKNILKGIFAFSIFGMMFFANSCKKEQPHTHEYDDGVVTKEATCTENGIKTFTCTGCDDSYTEDIPALGHVVVNDTAVAATCTTDGKTAGTHCSRCDAVITAQTTVPATGHTAVLTAGTPATCDVDGTKDYYVCSSCSAKFEDEACTKAIDDIDAWLADYAGGKIHAQHTLTMTAGTPATAFAAGTKDTWACSVCSKVYLDEACTEEVTEASQIVDPIKSITVTEAFAKPAEEPVVVRAVVVGSMSNNDYIELIVKDLENDTILTVSGYDNTLTTSSENYLVRFSRGQVISIKGTMKINDDSKIGGQAGKIRIASATADIEVSDMTAPFKVNHPENVPVATTTQELDAILAGMTHSQYQYVKLSGPIYGYFTSNVVRFWLGKGNNKDKLCTEEGGGSCLTCYGISPTDASRARPLINTTAISSNFGGKTMQELLGFADVSGYSGYSKYFTFEGDMYVMCVGGNIWSAHFLPLSEDDIIAHDTCSKFAVAHEAVALTQAAHGNIAYYECQYCGKLYEDAECTKEITLADTVIHNYVHHEAVAANCENDGVKEFYDCTLCSLKFFKVEDKYVATEDTMVVEKLGHNYGDLIPEVLPTVDATGLKAHYECSVCHKLFDAEKVETTIDALTIAQLTHNHTFTQLVEGKEATCNEDGWVVCYVCTYPDCGAIAAVENGEQVASSLDAWKAGAGNLPHHDFRHIEAVTVTCHSDGNVEYWYCADCNIYYKTADADKSQVYASIDETVIAKGHNYGTNTAVEIIRDQNGTARTLIKCDRCGHYVDQNTLEEFEGTITYSFNRATVGYTFKDGDKILIGNGQGGKGPGARLAFSGTNNSEETDKFGTRAYNDNNNPDVCVYYDNDCIFTLIAGTEEFAGSFKIQNCVGGYIDRAESSVYLGAGVTEDYCHWDFNIVTPSKPEYVSNAVIKAHGYDRWIQAQYTSSNGYRIGRKNAESVNTVAVYVYTATLVAVVA